MTQCSSIERRQRFGWPSGSVSLLLVNNNYSSLKLQLTGGETLLGALNALVTQKWAASLVNGQTILSTSEAGGVVTLTFGRAYTPAELATMAEDALEWVKHLGGSREPTPGCAPLQPSAPDL